MARSHLSRPLATIVVGSRSSRLPDLFGGLVGEFGVTGVDVVVVVVVVAVVVIEVCGHLFVVLHLVVHHRSH